MLLALRHYHEIFCQRLYTWRGRLKAGAMPHSNKRIGRWGERAARRHLEAAGIISVTTNWRARQGELDIIAIDKRTLVIVEVKTRHLSLKKSYPALSAVTSDKRHRLESLGRSFVRNHGPFCRRYAIKTRRIDALEVYYTRTKLGWPRISDIRWHRGIGSTRLG